jgi:hypothetical protein
VGRERGKESMLRVKRIKICYTYTCEDSIMKPTKHCLKEEKERGGEMGV